MLKGEPYTLCYEPNREVETWYYELETSESEADRHAGLRHPLAFEEVFPLTFYTNAQGEPYQVWNEIGFFRPPQRAEPQPMIGQITWCERP